MPKRTCVHVGCSAEAVAVLTYDYAQACVRLGPLTADPPAGAHELCLEHARAITAPRGWRLIRVSAVPGARPEPGSAAMALLADEVRRAGADPAGSWPEEPEAATVVELGRRGHLRVLVDAERVG